MDRFDWMIRGGKRVVLEHVYEIPGVLAIALWWRLEAFKERVLVPGVDEVVKRL